MRCVTRAAACRARSAQISTAKIAWKCASQPDDVISIEVWEVIDRCALRAPRVAQYTASLTTTGTQRAQVDGRRAAFGPALTGAPRQEGRCG